MTKIAAAVFDAYGTLFNVHAAVARLREDIGPQADRLSQVWRQKQLEYTWLRSLMQRHADFWQVTSEALTYAMESIQMKNDDLRDRLLALYRRLDAYPEVQGVLQEIRAAGIRTAILSNGAPGMLADAVESAGLGPHLDAVLSVEAVGVYKPAPPVYVLAQDRFGVLPSQIAFMTANAWDAAGAASAGLHVVWVNRFHQPLEQLPARPAHQIHDLVSLPALLTGASTA